MLLFNYLQLKLVKKLTLGLVADIRSNVPLYCCTSLRDLGPSANTLFY